MKALLCGIVALNCFTQVLAAPQAGSIIRNQAVSSYFNSVLGRTETVLSNSVMTNVSAVQGVSLTADTTLQTTPGKILNFPQQLCNTGNVPEVVTLSFSALNADFTMQNVTLINDLNSNGIVDSGEPIIANNGAVTLAYGQCMSLVLMANTPQSVQNLNSGKEKLTATLSDGTSAHVIDTAIVQSGPALTLTKSVSANTVAAGGSIRYSMTMVNTGDQIATGESITIDGLNQTAVLIRDAIPANMQLIAITNAGGGEALYHMIGQPFDTYQSVMPSAANLANVDAIAVAFTSISPSVAHAVAFDAVALASISGTINNTAQVFRGDSHSGSPVMAPSNQVTVIAPTALGTLDYFNTALDHKVTIQQSGAPLYLQAFAGACNTNASVAESYPITLLSEKTHDVEHLTMQETGANTGIFTLKGVATASAPPATVKHDDGTMQVTRNDYVDATMVCGGQTLHARILVDPSGVVYDILTDRPVAGASVTLVLAGTTTPPVIYDNNGNQLQTTVITQDDGVFRFPFVIAGNYQLLVKPPLGYSFPSQLPIASQPQDRRVIDGSFGKVFPVTDSDVAFDVPIDPASFTSGLHIQKKASKPVVSVGEAVAYTIDVNNTAGLAMANVSVTDDIPTGFKYVLGSARLNGQPLADPTGYQGSHLDFNVGAVGKDQQAEVTYVLRVGAMVAEGNSVNRAVAHAGTIQSGVANAVVQVSRDVFSDEAYVMGKVFVDCNGDRIQGKEELGIPGVKLVLDNGDFTITDSEGKYSFYGVTPRTHVIKIDSYSLPEGAELRTTSNRNAGNPKSLFVDVKKGELYRADFAEGSCTPDILAQVKARRAKGEIFASEIKLNKDSTFNADALSFAKSDPRTRPASGTLEQGQIQAYSPILFDKPQAKISESALDDPAVKNPTTLKLDSIISTITDNAASFMDLKDGDILASRDVSIRVKGPLGTNFVIAVNGEKVPQTQVGQKVTMPTRNLEAWEYVAVRLAVGVNEVSLTREDPFGNSRLVGTIHLTAPGEMAKLEIVPPANGVEADGQTPAAMKIRVVDSHGVLVTARTPVTLETNLGRWQVKDLDPTQPGIQTFIEGGESTFTLIPPDAPGDAHLRVSSGMIKQDFSLPLLPHLRPLIAAGLLEGSLTQRHLKADQLTPISPQDSFAQDIHDINTSHGDSSLGVRGSMYLKGKVKGSYLLTLAYDSDKGNDDPLFRDIDPEKYYPVYGDSSVKGFDAQSTSKLYVRLDKGRNYVLYGDFNTGGGYFSQNSGTAQQGTGGLENSELRLSTYQRALTGARIHREDDRGMLNVYASKTNQTQQIVEFRGQGISGPYNLNATNFVVNSEQINIITRDRNQPSIVISNTTLTRFSDYTVNTLDGSILFAKPIASVDANLNPVFIRAVFEVDNGGERSWVYGTDGQIKVIGKLALGGAYSHNDTPLQKYTLSGLNALWRAGPDSYFVVEAARSTSDLNGQGSAARAEWVQHDAKLESKVYVERATDQFDNPSAGLSAGHKEAGLKTIYKVDDKLRFGLQGFYSHDDPLASTTPIGTAPLAYGETAPTTSGTGVTGSRVAALGYAEYALTPRLTQQLGVRRAVGDAANLINGTPPQGPSNTTSILTKSTWRPDWLPKGSFLAEYEQDINDSSLREAAIGGNYQLGTQGQFYVRHELLSSLSSSYSLTEGTNSTNSTVVGVNYNYIKNDNVFSEYRIRDAIDGRAVEEATGLRNQWTLGDLRLSTQIEHVQPLSKTAEQNTAVALGSEYLISPLSKVTGRIEWRDSPTQRSLLNIFGYALKINRDWTFLTKNAWSYTDQMATSNGLIIKDRFRTGFAYRDTDTNRFDWLVRYERSYDREKELQDNRVADVISSNFNYHPSRPWDFNGRMAAKRVSETLGGVSAPNTAELIFGRATYDITERWDLGILASGLHDGVSGKHYGFGLEAGYLLTNNLWLSGGYNFFGFSDKDLAGSDYLLRGFFLDLRYKFDEDAFNWLQ